MTGKPKPGATYGNVPLVWPDGRRVEAGEIKAGQEIEFNRLTGVVTKPKPPRVTK